jgi:arylsulfatase
MDMKIGTIQSLACVGLGAMLGVVAATRDFTSPSRAGVAAPAARPSAAETQLTGEGINQPVSCDGCGSSGPISRN